jgi:hypothetical protein
MKIRNIPSKTERFFYMGVKLRRLIGGDLPEGFTVSGIPGGILCFL